ncbi:MAG: hypothetical protein IPI48_18835 [bacterium]|nr:hypothetical protein [bacterium]
MASQVKALAAECDRPDLLENATVIGASSGVTMRLSHYEFETPLASTEAGPYVIPEPAGGQHLHPARVRAALELATPPVTVGGVLVHRRQRAWEALSANT